MQKVGRLKYLASNINLYVLMIFTAFSLKIGGALAPPAPPIRPPMLLSPVHGPVHGPAQSPGFVLYSISILSLSNPSCFGKNLWQRENISTHVGNP